MSFVIRTINGLYFHNKGKIILFSSEDEAVKFLNMFVNYSINRLAGELRMDELMGASISINSECKIIPVNFDVENVECGTIYSEELFENKSKGEW